MIRIFSIAIISIILSAASAFADNNNYAQGTFPKKTHDFGIIKEENGPVSTEFEIVNTGNKPLIIVDVTTSCGCTSREYPKRPIQPGKSGKIKVIYNPAGRPGAFSKDVKVRTNGREKRTTLFIEGTTVPVTKK